MDNNLPLPVLHCKRCGHDWIPKKPRYPRVCSKCKSPYWNKEYSRNDMIGKETV